MAVVSYPTTTVVEDAGYFHRSLANASGRLEALLRHYRLLDRLASRIKESILAVLLVHRLAPKTLKNYNDALCHLALKDNLDDATLMWKTAA